VGLDVLVDLSLIRLSDLCELHAHSKAAIGPAHTALGVDLVLASPHRIFVTGRASFLEASVSI
jgi:hypothetical protein